MAQVLGLNFKTIRLGSCLYDQWLKEKSSFGEQLNALTYDGELLSSEVSAGDFLDHLLDVHRRMCRVCNTQLLNRWCNGHNRNRMADLGPSQTDRSPGTRSGHSDHTISDVRSPAALQHDCPLNSHAKSGEVSVLREENGTVECLADACTGTPSIDNQSVAPGETSNIEPSPSNQLAEEDGADPASGLVKSEHAWNQDIITSEERSCQEEVTLGSRSIPEEGHSHSRTGPWVCETVPEIHPVSIAQLGTSQPVPDLLTSQGKADEGLSAEDAMDVSRHRPDFFCGDCGQVFEDFAVLQQHWARSGSCYQLKTLLRPNHSSNPVPSSATGDAALEAGSIDTQQLQDENPNRRQSTSRADGLTCSLCSKVFLHQITFDLHMKVHRSRDAHVCLVCGSIFSDVDKLEQHTRHGCLCFPCPACSKKFKYRNSLHKHVMTKHSGQCVSGFETSVMSKSSAAVEKSQPGTKWPSAAEPAQQHLESSPSFESSPPEMFNAEAAAALPRQPSSLDAEPPTSLGINTLPSERILPSDQLRVPVESSVQHRHACDICHKVFRQGNNLKRHRRIHTNERPYKCNICLKAFAQSNTLKEHKHTHSSHKGYCCNACGKCFRQRSSMDKHKKTSSIRGITKCPCCDMLFVNKCTLRVHMASHMLKVV